MTNPPDREVAVFGAARRLPVGERAAYLDEACGGDSGLRQRVEELLRASEEAGVFLQNPAAVRHGPGGTLRLELNPTEKPGNWVGRYKLLQQIGEGGCGVVYMAEQTEPVHRRVALKVIKLGMDTKQVIARFEAERQAVALMDHPNIAKVLDAGATDAGRPYFVMELVRGIKITDYCDQNNLSTRERLDLFIQVCRAIQHAHQKGVIHRDIKPSNILVTVNDGVPVPKVIDFGIAKATQGRLTDHTLFTAFEQFIGTPAYMSPEQAEMTSLDIDTRSDIYSLGVLLYELLTGKTPFDGNALLQAGLDAMRRTIREVEPPKPSARLSTMLDAERAATASHRQTDSPKLVHLVRGDLDWIVMKALEKDRARRYETANGLASDIKRHMNCEPVVARPPSRLYEFQKTVRRHKFGFAATAALIIVLAVGALVSTLEALRATRAVREQSRLRVAAQNAQAKETQMREIAESREIAVRRNAYASDLITANLALEDGNLGLARTLLSQHQPEPDQEDLRGFEWRYLWGKSRGEQLMTLVGHSNFVTCIAYSPDGTILASGSSDHTVKLWNAKTGEVIATYAGHAASVVSVAFSPNGKLFASGDEDGLVRLWDAQAHQIIRTITTSNSYACLAFSDRFLAIATGGDAYGESDGSVQLWNYATSQMVSVLPTSGSRVAFNPDGKILATADHQLIKLWNLADQKCFKSYPSEYIRSMAFSPDGLTLVWCWGGGSIGLWKLANDRPTILPADGGTVFDVAFSPDGRLLATANQSHDISLFDVSSGQLLRRLLGHGNEVTAVAFSPDGKSLASGSLDDTVMLWNPYAGKAQDTITNIAIDRFDQIGQPVFSPDGRRLAAATVGGGVLLWESATGQVSTRRNLDGLPVGFSPDGKSLITRDKLFTLLRKWDVSTESLLASTKVATPNAEIYDSACSPDGKLIAISQRHKIILMSAITGEFLFALSQADAARCLAFSPDSEMIAAGNYDGTARIWDLKTRQVVWTVTGFRITIGAVAFSAHGLFAAGSWDGSIKVCDINAKKELATLTGHKAGVIELAFSSDGRTLASGSDDFTVKLWDLTIGREVITFKTDVAENFIKFSPDDTILATGSINSGVVHLYRAPSWGEITAAEMTEAR